MWTLYDDTNGNHYPLHNNSNIKLTLHEMDNASVQLVGTVTVDDKIHIVESGSGNTIFRGYIKNIDEQDTTKIKTLTLIETSNELKDTIAKSSGNASFILTGQTISAIMTILVSGTGWTLGTTDTTVVSTVAFTNTNVLTAINKLLYNMYNYEVWYVDNGTTKTIYWGTVRDVHGAAVVYKKKVQTNDSNNRNLTDITIFGSDDSIYGSASTGTTPKKEKYYRDETCKNSSECTKVAASLLADYRNPRNRYTLTLAPNYGYNICDQITVDSTTYIIRDITYTPTETQIGIGSYELSYSDTVGSDIQEITGSVTTGTDASWSGGNSNIASNGAAYTTYIWNIKDKSIITNAKIDAAISDYDSSVSVSANTNYLSDVSSTINSTTYSGSSSLIGYTTWYLPDGTSSDSSCYGLDCTAMTNGFQFGQCVFSGNVAVNTGYIMTLQWQVAYSVSGSPPYNWSDVGAPMYVDPVDTNWYFITFPSLVSGSSAAESSSSHTRYRLKVTCGASNQMKISDTTLAVQRVTRHLHGVTTTYDKSTAGTKPSRVICHVNSGSDFYLTPGNPQDIQSVLINGANTIYIKTESGSNNQCSVNPTITYQTLGKS